MPALIAHQLAFQLDTGEWLFQHINISLNDDLTGLIGRNGVGKSVLLSLLLGKLTPTIGSVSCQGQVGHYSQQPSELLGGTQTVADFLGVSEKLAAINAVEQGRCDAQYFDIIADDWEVATRTQQVLVDLGLPESPDVLCRDLSGGQLALLQLYQLFNSGADILLLDEPSNHLDARGRQWLISQLRQFAGKVLIVSHDRALLRYVGGVYHLTSLGMQYYQGNYDEFFSQHTLKENALERQITQLKSEQKKIERQQQASKEKAQQRRAQGARLRKSGSQPKILLDAMKNKAEQSQSAAAINQQNQLRRNQQKLSAMRQQQEAIKPRHLHLAEFGQAKKNTVLRLEGYKLPYGSKEPINLLLMQSERCYLTGGNGCGKSTLLKSIHQQAIKPASSNVSSPLSSTKMLANVMTEYLDQHFSLLSPDSNMLDCLMEYCKGLSESDARTLLAGIGFRRGSVYRQVTHLSGGEKMKLAILMVSHLPDQPLLLLDEPDNHLDIDAKLQLAKALNQYRGAFILVSHDEDFAGAIQFDRQLSLSVSQ
ncbi:ABC-F family ATP-binding cassette domain-containing protein [Photobacterium sp. BZF1]|uniref:ATP-binding cassette domain-containing protein n=1 Tax=Photobacterium sp. BZF1 TaxID=1904457 RepID=UPI0016538F1C|nr:ATP-binding cassette domain-containing protein [Photobacterium sp. BZF1]MBC7001114.1 ABC-F family ATP-binding cassette domain-containing protein [Photobacterium sp. BZF1]